MEKKLLFFDIDGTLIDEKGNFPESAKEAIRRAQQGGHLCFVNTGRTASIVLDWLPQECEFDGYLCGCGTHLIFHDRILKHRSFTPEQGQRIIDGLEKYKIDAILEGIDNDFHNEIDRMHTETFRNYILKHGGDRKWGSYQEAVGRFDKFYCFADRAGAVTEFGEEYRDLLDLIDREQGFYEVVPKGFSKASGMDDLLEYLNGTGEYEAPFTRENTVAIGDSGNDLPMLMHAGCAIAMGNSSKVVLEAADYITGSVLGNGIAEALEWLGVCS